MDGLKQWQAHFDIYHPKLKVLRAEWIAAKKQIDAFRSLPQLNPTAPLGELRTGMETWLTTLQLRSLATVPFGSEDLYKDISVKRIMSDVMQEVGTVGRTAKAQSQICTGVTRQKLDGLVEAQELAEKAIAKGFKELILTTNSMSNFLTSEMHRDWARKIEKMLRIMRGFDDTMLDHPEDSEEYQHAWRERTSMTTAGHDFLLRYSQVDKQDKQITALMAQLGTNVARQRTLWEYDGVWEDAYAAATAHDRFVGRVLAKREATMEARQKGEEMPGKWYETRRQSLVTEFYSVVERRDSKVKGLGRKMAELGVESTKDAGSLRQATVDEVFIRERRRSWDGRR